MRDFLMKKDYEILSHALGTNRQKKSFRNYFAAGKKSADYPYLQLLVKQGFMKRRGDNLNQMSVSYIYQVTEKGKIFAKKYKENLEAKIHKSEEVKIN